MLSRDTAVALQESGVVWRPQPGDRFMLRGDEMAEDVFHVSGMTIEVLEWAEGSNVRFHGTTEWALDSTDMANTIWLPLEGQLRDLLGDRLVSLTRDGDDWVVTLDAANGSRTVRHADVEEVYAAAVLAL